MPREAYCEHCDRFQPLASDDRNLACAICAFIIARQRGSNEMYCDNCAEYKPVVREPLHPPLPTDMPNQGYLLGDILCPDCCSIFAAVREPA